MQVLQEKMCEGMNLTIRDENEDERDDVEVDQEEQEEEVLNLEEERLFKAITKIAKRTKFNVSTFSRKLNQRICSIG